MGRLRRHYQVDIHPILYRIGVMVPLPHRLMQMVCLQ